LQIITRREKEPETRKEKATYEIFKLPFEFITTIPKDILVKIQLVQIRAISELATTMPHVQALPLATGMELGQWEAVLI
jgi:hypothetical protein